MRAARVLVHGSLGVAAAMLAAATPAAGQTPMAGTATPVGDPRIARAQANAAIGDVLWRGQVATKVAVEQFVADLPAGRFYAIGDRATLRDPFFTHVVGADLVDVVFVRREGLRVSETFRYHVRSDGTATLAIPARGSRLGLEEARMAVAAETLRAIVAGGSVDACGGASGIAVLPPAADGSVTGYVLGWAGTPDSVNTGGHARVAIGPDLTVRSITPLGACRTIAWDPADEELNARVVYVEAPDEAQPTELHAFLSHQLPFAMGVITGNTIWPMIGGQVDQPVPFDPETGDTP